MLLGGDHDGLAALDLPNAALDLLEPRGFDLLGSAGSAAGLRDYPCKAEVQARDACFWSTPSLDKVETGP